jgi:NADH:ubiquinone oxidoreductase subunit C
MNDILPQIKERFNDVITAWDDSHERKVYVDISGNGIFPVADYTFNVLGCRFITISASDMPQGIEMLYHFSHDLSGTVISFRLLIADKAKPSIESISPLFIGSRWIEREVHELMGVNFTGNSEQAKHLLLPDDWPGGVFPLRKDFIVKQENHD